MLVPLSYNLRSLFVRRSSTLLTVFGIGATVAVVAGVLALQQGFASLYETGGDEDVAIFLRPGASYEGESMFTRETATNLAKSLPEVAEGPDGAPLASLECFLARRMEKTGGGETNIPVRGVQPQSFAVRGDAFRIVEGRNFTPGTDEVVCMANAPDDRRALEDAGYRAVGAVPMFVLTAASTIGDDDRLAFHMLDGDLAFLHDGYPRPWLAAKG